MTVASLSAFLPGLERHLYFCLCFLKGSKARLKKKIIQNCYLSVILPQQFFLLFSDCLSVSFFLYAGNMSETGVVWTVYV